MICVVMNLLRNCLYRRVLWEMLGLLTGLSDLCDTVVRLPYPEKTVYDVIRFLIQIILFQDLWGIFPALSKTVKEMCSDVEGMTPWKWKCYIVSTQLMFLCRQTYKNGWTNKLTHSQSHLIVNLELSIWKKSYVSNYSLKVISSFW